MLWQQGSQKAALLLIRAARFSAPRACSDFCGPFIVLNPVSECAGVELWLQLSYGAAHDVKGSWQAAQVNLIPVAVFFDSPYLVQTSQLTVCESCSHQITPGCIFPYLHL